MLEAIELIDGRVENFAIGMSGADDRDPTIAIEVPPSLVIEEIGSLAADQHRRLAIKVVNARHKEIALHGE
jgi:hypothetical protein